MNKPQTAFFYLLLIFGLLIPDSSKAELRLPAIVSSNMVLQRNTTITLWGWADSEEALKITASWLKKPIKIAADFAGDWQVEVQTTGSKEPQTIKISSRGKDIVLENILFGEVWLCSGQSNMEQAVSGYYGQPTFGAQEAISTAKNDKIRLFTAAQPDFPEQYVFQD